ncbi:uncharacterized protein SCHCODRAFT_02667721 [Schizophyllum commune H4-8]|nr:uncharacterized protein SCHCODRAFT_02667721 [Schizophyllum commune H4-8]KAI5892218.1 hypothetical protein SCHCODRAFT_02667721 [Schizophyllum commune H4-8]
MVTTKWSTTSAPTPPAQAATASETVTTPRQASTSPSSEGQISPEGRFEVDSELSRSPCQADSTCGSEVEVHPASRASAAQASSSSKTASNPSLSDGRIAYLLSDEAFLNHYALTGSEWGWGYGPTEEDSSGLEPETNSGATHSLDASSSAPASSASSSTQNPPQVDPSHPCTICQKQFTRSLLTTSNFDHLKEPETHLSAQAKHARGAYEHAPGSYV